MSKRIVAIHQPDFMPWYGFFNKISKADVFIVLDHVTNNPNDGFWCKRVKMLIGGEPKWVTIPLEKSDLGTYIPINQMKVSKTMLKDFKNQHKTILYNYSNHPYFSDIADLVENYFSTFETNLKNKNLTFIKAVLSILNIQAKIICSSDLKPSGEKNSLLIDLISKVNGTHYLAGQGAKDYQIDSIFKEKFIETSYNSFKHPWYKQKNNKTSSFFEGLSIVDIISNVGIERTRNYFLKNE